MYARVDVSKAVELAVPIVRRETKVFEQVRPAYELEPGS